MARPTRRLPALRLFESPQAAYFIDVIASTLGGNFALAPIERADEIHVFIATGPATSGLLFEAPEQPLVGGVWRHREGYYHRHPELPLHLWVELTAHGWDPNLASAQTGDCSGLMPPTRRRNELRERKSRDVAASLDACRQVVLGYNAPVPLWPGLSEARLGRLWLAYCRPSDGRQH